jgi:hypothetical protein
VHEPGRLQAHVGPRNAVSIEQPAKLAAGHHLFRVAEHALFAPIGVDIWKQDLLDFLTKQTR